MANEELEKRIAEENSRMEGKCLTTNKEIQQ